MTRKRKLLIVGFIVALLPVLAISVLALLIDVDRYRGFVEDKLEEALGREVRLGAMGLSIWPVLGLEVADFAIEALPSEGTGDLVSAKKLRVGARLLPLLGKRLEVTSLVIEEPELQLVRDADGRWNVDSLLAGREDDERQSGETPSASTEPSRSALTIGRLRLSDGRLTVVDHSRGGHRQLVIEDLQLDVSNLGSGGPVPVELEAQVRGSRAEKMARVVVKGRVELDRELNGAFTWSGEGRWEGLDGALIEELAAVAGVDLGGIVGPRPSSGSAKVALSRSGGGERGAAPLELQLTEVEVREIDIRIDSRSPSRSTGEASRSGGSSEPASTAFEWDVEDLRLVNASLLWRGRRSDGEELTIELADVDVALDRWPDASASSIRLSAELVAPRGGTIDVEGTFGPLGRDLLKAPLDITVRAKKVSNAMLSVLGGASGEGLRFDDSGSLDLEARLEGDLERGLLVAASLDFDALSLRGLATDDRERAVVLDLSAEVDLRMTRGGKRIEIERLDLRALAYGWKNEETLHLSGWTEARDGGRDLELTIPSMRLTSDTLNALIALVQSPPVATFEASQAIEIEVRVAGFLSEDSVPEVTGRLALRETRVSVAALSKPIESLTTELTFAGDRIETKGASGRIGESDFTADLAVALGTTPHVSFDLTSQRADLSELLGLLQSQKPASDAATEQTTENGGAAKVVAEGTMRIARGSWDALELSNLQATLVYRDGIATLEPVRMNLYSGTFRGGIRIDLREQPPRFALHGEAEDVDLEPFLSQGLQVDSLLAGRFTGTLEAEGAGGDYESLMNSLAGGGIARVDDGRIRGLDLLRSLSRVAGLFGQRTLGNLAARIADESTTFSSLEGRYRLEGGKMSVEELLLETPDLMLRGRTSVDLLTTVLSGDFEIRFGERVSSWMKEEGGRAAEVFRDDATGQIVMPLSLSGKLGGVSASVDWRGATTRFVKRRAQRELLDLLRDRLGGKEDERDAPAAEAPSQPSRDQRPGEPIPASVAGDDLGVEITRVRWGGSILLQDLKLEGRAWAGDLSHLSLEVRDALGRVLKTIDPIGELSTAEAGRVSWNARVDGRRFLIAAFPVDVIVTAHDRDGRKAEATRRVER